MSRTTRKNMPKPAGFALFPPLTAAPGEAALAGQVVLLDGKPLAGVTLHLDELEGQTDETGRFLLTPAPPGHHELLIDGSTVSDPEHTYGRFEVGVDVEAGRTS